MVLLEQEPPDDKPVARGCHTFGRIKTLKTQLLLADPPQGYFKVYAFPPGKGKNLSRYGIIVSKMETIDGQEVEVFFRCLGGGGSRRRGGGRGDERAGGAGAAGGVVVPRSLGPRPGGLGGGRGRARGGLAGCCGGHGSGWGDVIWDGLVQWDGFLGLFAFGFVWGKK